MKWPLQSCKWKIHPKNVAIPLPQTTTFWLPFASTTTTNFCPAPSSSDLFLNRCCQQRTLSGIFFSKHFTIISVITTTLPALYRPRRRRPLFDCCFFPRCVPIHREGGSGTGAGHLKKEICTQSSFTFALFPVDGFNFVFHFGRCIFT